MLRRTLVTVSFVSLAAAFSGCNSAKKTVTTTSAAPTPPSPAANAPAAGAKLYGQPLQPADVKPLADVLAKPDQFANQTVTVAAQVRKACTRKGCWMELAESTKQDSPGCRVTFKNYGFFVPIDSAGSTARVQGKVEVDTLSASAVRHYEEEGAKFVKAPDGTAREVRIVATGVELTRPTTVQ
jgi:hypothetical protein